MAITAERMQRLIAAASTINESLQGLDRAMAQWDVAIAQGELTYEEAYRNIRPWLYRMGPRPSDLAVIEVEEKHFSRQRGNLYRARTRMEALREGEPPRRPHEPRPRGYTTAPHDPTGLVIAEAHAQPQSPSARPMPRNAAELAAYTVEADRIMAADKANLVAREAHKPKPLPFAPPRSAPTNPYENDGMPDIPPGITAEDLLRAESEAKARNGKNSSPEPLTPEPTRAIVQGSEQEPSP